MADRNTQLRVGVMVRDASLRAWQADVLRNLLEVDGVEIVAAVVDARPPPGRRRRPADVLWDLYNNRWVARRARSMRRVELGDVVPGLEIIECVVRTEGRWSELFTAEDVDRIRSMDLDVLLRFGFGIIRGDILTSARFGVWSFHHDDDDVVRGGPPAFWEIVEGVPVTGTVLQRLTDRLDGGHILHKGWFRTERSSYVKNNDAAHLGAAVWPARVARALLAGDPHAAVGIQSTSTAVLRRKPSNEVSASFLLGQSVRWTFHQMRSVASADDWHVGIVYAPISALLDESCTPDVEWLPLTDGRRYYAADPFHVLLDDRPCILFERYDQTRRHGQIWTHDLTTGASTPTLLDVAPHASYPFVIETDEGPLCVPQVAGRPAVTYRWHAGAWREGEPLGPNRPVLDPTVFRHEGRWWLFATLPGPWSLVHLHAWWAKRLEGPWAPHLLNPVKTDVRSARPAGTPFRVGGRLFRPAQDGSAEYGGAVAICEIEELEPDAFRERTVRVLRPSPTWPYGKGVHTLSAAGDMTLLDAKRRTVHVASMRAEVAGRLRRGRTP